MAIYRLSAKIVSRKGGQSAVAAAAYRSGTILKDARTGEVKDYSARSHAVVFAGLFAPKDAPDWVRDREQLWNHVEQIEKRKDAQLAREFQLALPHEMTDQQREWLVKDYVREQFVRHGFVVDVAIHAPDRRGDDRNHHAHLLVTQRTVDADGFAATKDRAFNDRGQLAAWREGWEHLVNRHLERHGIDARIDHRSHADRGIDAEPSKYEGPTVTELARDGIITERRLENVEIRLRNTIRNQPNTYIGLRPADVVIEPSPASGRQEEDERPRVDVQGAEPALEHDWTSRGGMVAQQASAAIWAKDAERRSAMLRPTPPEIHAPVSQGAEIHGDAPAATPVEINRQQAAQRQQAADSPVQTLATQVGRQTEQTPASAAAPSKSAQESERDRYLAAFDRTYAQNVQEREQGNEQDGGRGLDR